MRFKVNREQFANVLSDFLLILKENPIKPIIVGLKIEVTNENIILTGTNLESTLIKRVDGEILEEGIIIIKPQLMLEYIKLLDIDELEISSNNNLLFVHQAEFVTMNGEEYPKIEEYLPIEVAKYNSDSFSKALEKTKFSSYQTADNLALNCVRVIFSQDKTEFVSTDSYRLTYLKENVKSIMNREFSIPLETVNALVKLLKDSSKELTVGFSDKYLLFTWENNYYATRIIELPYPDFKQILSYDSFNKFLEFNTPEYKSALKKVLTVARTSYDKKYGAIFDFKGKMLKIESQSGKGKTVQKVNMLKDGDDFKGSLNIKFILEFLSNISKNLVIKATNSSSMFKMEEFENSDYIYILMPLALKD